MMLQGQLSKSENIPESTEGYMLRRKGQVDLGEFKTSQDYIAGSRTAKGTWREPLSQKHKGGEQERIMREGKRKISLLIVSSVECTHVHIQREKKRKTHKQM